MNVNEQALLMIGVILAVIPITLAVLSDLYEGHVERKKEKQRAKEEHCHGCGGCCDELCGCQACVQECGCCGKPLEECECQCSCHKH